MNISTLNYTLEDLTKEANHFKEIFITKMLKEKIITEEIAQNMLQYSIVVSHRGALGRVWDKLFKLENEKGRIFIVKVIEDDIEDDNIENSKNENN